MNAQRRISRVSGWVLTAVLAAPGTMTAQLPDRSEPPTLGPPPALELPAIQRFRLSNGLPVLLMEKHGVPLVQVNLLVRAGSAMDPADKPGLADFTAELLDEGAGGRNALELADAIDYLGARLSVSAGLHSTTIELHTPLSKLEAALAIMADVALRPTFPSDEVSRERKSRLTTLLQWHDEPSAIAAALFRRALYGADHPYGRSSLGDEAAIRSTDTAALRQFYERHFHPDRAVLIVVGDVTADQVTPMLEAGFGAWRPAGLTSLPWHDAKQVRRREVFLVDKPGAAQSEIRIGRIGPARSTDDYFPLVVMNTILGGSFTSRLNQNLREEKGYSYGAGSAFVFREHPGPFVAFAAVQTDVTDKALTEFMRELTGMLDTVSNDELQRAKNFVALRFPGSFQSVSQIAGRLEELVEYDLPPDYFNQFVDRVLAVSREDVQRVARTYLDPDRVVIVVVGDRAKIERGVRALGLGPVRVLSVDQVLGKPPAMDAG